MSHTNSTTNYNLPQFVGTDKPAWLTDINGAFSSIDTAIKGAKDTADTGSANATSALNKIGDLTTLTTTAKTDVVAAVNEVKSDAGTAQTTANTANGTASALATEFNTFVNKFNLSATTSTATITPTKGSVTSQPKLSQNSDGSMFKFYGLLQVNAFTATNGATLPLVSVPGLNASTQKAVATGCYLSSAPDEAYIINGACHSTTHNQADTDNTSASVLDIAVGTDGQIYLDPTNSSSSWNFASGTFRRFYFPPCVYFNTNFGDIPTPQD